MTDSLTIHHTAEPNADTSLPDPHQDNFSKTLLGFWIYLMTDCILFVTLFVSYAVLHDNTFGGATSKEVFRLSTTFAETIILLISSFTCGLAVLSAAKNKTKNLNLWLLVTLVFGLAFLYLEIAEFAHHLEQGNSWKVSAFLSAYFGLVGTHGIHIIVGCLWLIVLMAQLLLQGLTIDTFRRLVIFSLFWHFLDLIWIFVFSFVYLMGVI